MMVLLRNGGQHGIHRTYGGRARLDIMDYLHHGMKGHTMDKQWLVWGFIEERSFWLGEYPTKKEARMAMNHYADGIRDNSPDDELHVWVTKTHARRIENI